MNKKRHKSFQPDFWKIVSLVLMVILAVFLLYPLITIGYKSLLNTEGQFTLSNYKDFFTLKYYTSALGHSFLVCSIATVFATLVSVPIAYLSSRYNVACKKLLNMVIILSMISPPLSVPIPGYCSLAEAAWSHPFCRKSASTCLPFMDLAVSYWCLP